MFKLYNAWSLNNYFDEHEFRCSCCHKSAMQFKFIKKLTHARHLAAVPFIINSGFRCRDHNKFVCGKSNSSHLVGLAADIACNNGVGRVFILSGLIKAGFKRIGIYPTFIHVDFDSTKPDNVWLG